MRARLAPLAGRTGSRRQMNSAHVKAVPVLGPGTNLVGRRNMKAVRTFVALLILLAPSEPAFALVPGCINGLLLDPRAYVQFVINRQVGQPAPDWEAVLQASGIPATSSVPGTVAGEAFYGITQWKGSAGNVRGRLSLPTATPDALGYLTRSVDLLADNPAWPVPCWQDARACVWAWREHFEGPAYAPRRCESRPTLANDFNGDGRSDPAVFRPANSAWYSMFANGMGGIQWGVASDISVPGDYDGDGRSDVAVYRPSSGHWFLLRSSTSSTTWDIIQWGTSGDIPVPADYDGDGRADPATYRPSTGLWSILRSSSGFSAGAGFLWGAGSDRPVAADFDGDAKADLGVYRPSTGHWFILLSTTGYQQWLTLQWGTSGDVPVAGDYDGDRRTDITVYRPSNGTWYILSSSTGFTRWAAYIWAAAGDVPVEGDFDGDGVSDITVYRPSSAYWFVLRSSTGFTAWDIYQWGQTGDVPISVLW